MTKQQLRDLVERAVWTAAQAFLGVFAVTGVWDADISSAKQGAIVAIAAAISVLKTAVQNVVSGLDTRAARPS